MERYKSIERSIITKYRKTIWAPFHRAVSDYELIQEGDSLMVCISGGKDSFLLAKCIEELRVHGNVSFDAKYVVMDPGYLKSNRDLILENAKILNIDLEVFESNIFEVVNSTDFKSPCYLCARMRRGYLYNHARELGCNKIVLGHHFDDVIETTLLSMFYGAEVKTMLPKIKSDNFPGLELIRPMYLIKEVAIISWAKYNDLHFLNCACRFMEMNHNKEIESKRKEMKDLIKNLRNTYKEIDNNIFKSMGNVNLNCVLGYHKDKVSHSFLDDFKEK